MMRARGYGPSGPAAGRDLQTPRDQLLQERSSHEENIPAAQAEAEEHAWIPGAHGDEERSSSPCTAARKGSQEVDRQRRAVGAWCAAVLCEEVGDTPRPRSIPWRDERRQTLRWDVPPFLHNHNTKCGALTCHRRDGLRSNAQCRATEPDQAAIARVGRP